MYSFIYTHNLPNMVAEHGASHVCASERKQLMDVLVPHVMEEIFDVVKSNSRERIQQRIVEEIADVLVRSIQEQTAEVESLKNDVAETKSSVAADQNLAAKLAESCRSQSREWF